MIFLATKKDYAQPLPQNDTTLSRNLDIFSSVYRKVISEYPDTVDPRKFMLTGMNQMLQSLDPFTNFFTESDVREFKTSLSGKFGGTGMVIGNSKDGIFIKEIFTNKPAARAGLRPADLIKEINGTATKNKSIDEVMSLLRGTPGTSISIVATHPADTQKTSFNFEREMINISPVPYYGMLNEHIAYISLTRESEDCSNEVKAALKELYDNNHFKGLVFDLRSNEGGYFKEAIKIVNLFIDKGGLLTSVRGKDNDTAYHATNMADYPTIPLVLLTDDYTASSGEILTGAIQDNDRAVIIGQKTYGKGLVQQIFDMPGGTQLKLTTAHYYTPSGRCIQAFEYDKGNKIQLADSTKKVFKTKNGRNVYSNGGISPDITMDYNKLAAITQNLLQDFLIFDFATKYKISHPSIGPAATFYLTDRDYIAFIKFVKSRKYTYITDTEKKLTAIKELAVKEGYWQAIQSNYTQMENKLISSKEKELLNNKTSIKKALEEEITYRYYYQKGRFETRLRDDREVKKAVETLMDPILYNRLLHTEK